MTMSDLSQSGVEAITAERERQIRREGWTPEHDDRHHYSQLARAAAAYALGPIDDAGTRPTIWPFLAGSYKPTPDDRVRELAKAGALIAAEIDRLLRLDATSEKEKADEP